MRERRGSAHKLIQPANRGAERGAVGRLRLGNGWHASIRTPVDGGRLSWRALPAHRADAGLAGVPRSRFRIAYPRRRPQRGCGHRRDERARGGSGAFTFPLSEFALLAGCGYESRVITHADVSAVSKFGYSGLPFQLAGVRRVLRSDARDWRRGEHQGHVLGHSATTRIWHRRVPYLRRAGVADARAWALCTDQVPGCKRRTPARTNERPAQGRPVCVLASERESLV